MADAGTQFGASETQRIAIDQFWHFARLGARFAIGLHLVFAAAGLLVGSIALVAMQVATIVIYGACYWLAGRGYRNASIALTWIDLLGHSYIACWIVGVNSGFQYYSWIMLPLLFANVNRSARFKYVTAVLLVGFYVAMDWWLHRAPPLTPIDPGALAAMRSFNIICFLAALGIVAVLHANSVDSAAKRLNSLASTDALTGLMNRRRISDALVRECAKAERSQLPWSVLLLDVDRFKSINDQFGHARGDQVIVSVGEVLRAKVRQHDSVARWGGEEFLVLMPESNLAAAGEVAERIRRAIATSVVRDEQDSQPVTVTIGVAQWCEGESVDETVQRADAALYLGKHSGRDQVRLSQAEVLLLATSKQIVRL